MVLAVAEDSDDHVAADVDGHVFCHLGFLRSCRSNLFFVC